MFLFRGFRLFRCLLNNKFHISHFTCHLSPVSSPLPTTHYSLHTTLYTLNSTHYISHFTFHIFNRSTALRSSVLSSHFEESCSAFLNSTWSSDSSSSESSYKYLFFISSICFIFRFLLN